MRNIREGYLTDKWKNFVFDGYFGDVTITLDSFEKHYGKFVSAVYPDVDSERPYAIWTDENVVLILHKDDRLGIASITRNPSKFSFG